MRYGNNDDKNSRLKFFASATAGVAAGAFLLKDNGGNKIISKVLGNITEAVSGISDDLSKLSFKEMDSSNLSRIIKTRILDEDSTYKAATRSTVIKNIDQSKGLFSSLRDFRSFQNKNDYTKNQIKDNYQMEIIMKGLREKFNTESKEFFSQAQVLTKEALNKKHRFFETENGEYIKAIRSEFTSVTTDEMGLFNGKADDIADVFEEALNTSKQILDDVENNYDINLHPQIEKEYKDLILEKYSKNNDFFKDSLDRAANIDDFLRALSEEKIERTDSLTEIETMFHDLISEDESYGNLIVDSKSLRVDKNNELYSKKAINDITNTLKEESADTIFGKLFGVRSHLLNKQAPDFQYFGQGNFDAVIGGITNSETGLLKYDHFILGKKLYQYKDGLLNHLEDAGEIGLIGGKHGPMAALLNTISGNTYYNPTTNTAAKQLDIGTKGVSSLKKRLGIMKKFDAESTWSPNVVSRLLGTKYDNIAGNSELMSGFFKDLELTNKMYSDQSFIPSGRFINEFKKNTKSSSVRTLLNSLESKNIAEDILANKTIDHDKLMNKDLRTLLRKYEKNLQSVNNTMHIGELKSLGGGKNILNYNQLLTREVIKESLLRESLGHKTNLAGYSVTKSKIKNLSINGKDKRQANDLFNWAILQKEGDLFTSSLHSQNSVEFKNNQHKNINELLKTRRNNAQEQAFLKSFQEEIGTFAKENSSVLESIEGINNRVIKPYTTGTYVAMRSSVTVNDLIRSLNDDTKFKSTSKKFVKQLYAGRNNMNDLTKATLIPFHMLNRLMTPLEEIGLGFSRESTKSIGNLAKNMGTKRVLPAMALAAGFSYLNFESKNLTGTSFSESWENTKANLALGAKTIEDGLGLDEAGKRSVMYNPIARYWGGDHKTKDEYLDHLEYGYNPIRKGRFWSFGSSAEFRGSKVSYWKPNNLRLAHSNYYDISVYGSSDEKWKHSWIPTPRHPLSTLRALIDPYWLEKKHYEDRPYPVTGKMFTDGTPWGAVLNPTIGAIMKPEVKMHKRELGRTLTDVRSLIAEKNEEIRRKSSERSIVRLNNTGFTPMAFNPNSQPSLGEAVFSVNTSEGRVTSAGFMGQGYADSLRDINSSRIPTTLYASQYGTGSDASTGSGSSSGGQSYTPTINTENASSTISAVTTMVRLGVATNLMNSSSAVNLIRGANNSIFAQSEMKREGIINEAGTLHTTPFRNAAEKSKTKFSEQMISGENKSDFVHDMIYSGSQLSGMYGFLAKQTVPSSRGYKLENANMASFATRFWDTSIGGIGGDMMEIARRFFPHEDHGIEQINPIRNTMPEWMPARFKKGDPYNMIPLGDARLPGAGYESLNKLHSDQYGRYGAFDRYKILADISPFSEEYKTWKKISKTISDPFLVKQMAAIEDRVKEQTKEHDFYNYKFLGRDLDSKKAVINTVDKSGSFTVLGSEQQYTLAGIEPLVDKVNKVNYIDNYLQPGMQVDLKYEDNEYRKRDSEGNISALVYFGGESISKKMFEEKTGKEKYEKETLADEYFALKDSNIAMGHVYEAIGHMPVPFLHNKFLRIDSPMESYKKEQVYGTPFSTWSHPIKGFIQPTFQQAWGQGIGFQALGFSTFLLSNYASHSKLSKSTSVLAHTAFAMTNPGGFAGGLMGYLPMQTLLKGSSKIWWNSRNLSNVGAAVGVAGFAVANLENPFLSAGNFALAGIGIANHFKHTTKAGKKIGGKEGALIGAAIGLGLSSLKNPEFSLNKLTEKYVPKDTKKKWEIEEYYDRLDYLKYTNLYEKAARIAKRKEGVNVTKIVNKFERLREKNVDEIRKLKEKKLKIQKYVLNESLRDQLVFDIDQRTARLQTPEQYFKMGEYTKSALAYKKAADTTIYGLNEYAFMADVLRAIPKYDRDYFMEFAKEKDPKERKKILKYISPYKQKALKVLWKEDVKEKDQESNRSFFSTHQLPTLSWSGWNPSSNLDNIKIKTIENEGMLLSDFGMYDSQKDEPAYMASPEIGNMRQPTSPLAIQRDLMGLLNGIGFQNVEVSVDQSQNSGFEIISNISRITTYNLQEKISSTLGNIF